MDILEGFLADTPSLVYTQLRRDKPLISYEEVVKELRVCFGRPLDARLARHKIYDLTWTPGESLAHLATRIRELHFQAHSKTPFEEREVYAGDTFYRLLPREWKLRIRDKNLSSLSEYLSAAMECEDRDQESRSSFVSPPVHVNVDPPVTFDEVPHNGPGVHPATFGTWLITCHSDRGARSVGQSLFSGNQSAGLVYSPLEVEGVATPLQTQEVQNAMNQQIIPFEVGDQVVISPKELRRAHVYQKGWGTGIILRKANVNAIVQLQYGTRTFTRKFRLTRLMKLDTEQSPRDPRPTMGCRRPSVVSVGTSEAHSGEGRSSGCVVHPGQARAEQVSRVRQVQEYEAPVEGSTTSSG
ncbi:MAG: hypothetical protein GY696_01435, partial [Gammaproteobacteria bacterium]|nr:hypothetical protein [Gammaproteobacteria bacterium]